ncbi:hypothetical protein MMC11_008230 [Xylographa trunciseda]|nr:hypothetical protein [Xylographa trunciseda]
MSLLRRMSELGSKLSSSGKRSNTPDAFQGSKGRERSNTSHATDFPNSSSGRKRSHTTKKHSKTIDESDLVLHLLRLDIAMHSYFCFHSTPAFQYPGTWVSKTLQQLLTHVPILYPKDPSAYQDWIVSLAISFIEQHSTNIKQLTDIARQIRAGTLNEKSKPRIVPVSRTMNSDLGRLTELVRQLEPRLGKPKHRAELFELTNVCISSLKQQLVAVDEDWDFHIQPVWEGDYLRSIEDTWDYIHSSHGRTPFNNKELTRAVELIYNAHASIEPNSTQEHPDSDEEIKPYPTPESTDNDGSPTKPNGAHRRHLHTDPSSEGEDSANPHGEHRLRFATARALRTEQEQEEYIAHLKRRRARKEKEEAENPKEKGNRKEGEELHYRQQRRRRKEESEQEYLEQMQRNRLRGEREEQECWADAALPVDEYLMSGGL